MPAARATTSRARTQPTGADSKGGKLPLRKRRPRLFYGLVAACCLLSSLGVAVLVVYLVVFRPDPGIDAVPNGTDTLLALTGCAGGSTEAGCERFEFAHTLTYAVAMGSPELLDTDVLPAISGDCTTAMWNRQCSSCWPDLQAQPRAPRHPVLR